MGLINGILELVFGGGRNVVRDTAEVFRPNAEAADRRDLAAFEAALRQHGAEFRENRSAFDRLMDGLNRLPRPAMALGAIGLFVAAMADPVWFSERMQGLALVPEALWWLLGAVVSFYFGARHQVKGHDFQREIARTMARTPDVVANLRHLRALDAPERSDPNPALEAWRKAG